MCDLTHLDLDAGILEVPSTQEHQAARVRLHAEVIGLLDRYLHRRGDAPGPAVPRPERGGRLTSNGIGQMFERRCELADVKVSAHTFPVAPMATPLARRRRFHGRSDGARRLGLRGDRAAATRGWTPSVSLTPVRRPVRLLGGQVEGDGQM